MGCIIGLLEELLTGNKQANHVFEEGLSRFVALQNLYFNGFPGEHSSFAQAR